MVAFKIFNKHVHLEIYKSLADKKPVNLDKLKKPLISSKVITSINLNIIHISTIQLPTMESPTRSGESTKWQITRKL